MNNTVIAVDAGKAETKIVVKRNDKEIVRDHFPTAIGQTSDGRVDLLDNVHTFSSKTLGTVGKEIRIGCDELPVKADDNFSKDSDINRICTMYAIAKNVIPGETVNVVTGCPLSIYSRKEERTEYGRNIIPNGKVECVIDGKPVEFTIDKRLVCAESTGILTLHPEIFSKKDYDAAIIDMGGLNMNITAINNSNVISESSHTSRHGGRMLHHEIQRLLMDNGMEITDAQILSSVLRGYVNYHDPNMREISKDIISRAVTSFIDEIDRTLRNSWKNFDTLELFFIGGTAFLLKDYLAERFGEHAHFEKNFEASRYANAEGFALRMYRKLTENHGTK